MEREGVLGIWVLKNVLNWGISRLVLGGYFRRLELRE